MKTVEEILRESGLNDEQIKAIDAKVTGALGTVLSTAAQEREAAEIAQRATADHFTNEISPALDKWANEKASYETKMAAYHAALEAAKEGGFQVPEILTPPTTATVPSTRAADGKFVAGANQVPGSPQFVAEFRKEAGAAIGSMLDLTWKYSSLYGKPMPDSPTALIAEANAQRMDPIVYAAKKYDFAGKEAAMKADEQKKHDENIVRETEARKDKEWSEKVGNNPNIRQAEVSRFSEINKAVKSGTRPDPLAMNEAERDASTRRAIRSEVAATDTVQ